MSYGCKITQPCDAQYSCSARIKPCKVATSRAPGDAPAFCGMATALKFGRTGKRGDYRLRRGAYIARAAKSQGDTDIGRERLPQNRVQARRQLLDRAGIAVDAVDDIGAGLAAEALWLDARDEGPAFAELAIELQRRHLAGRAGVVHEAHRVGPVVAEVPIGLGVVVGEVVFEVEAEARVFAGVHVQCAAQPRTQPHSDKTADEIIDRTGGAGGQGLPAVGDIELLPAPRVADLRDDARIAADAAVVPPELITDAHAALARLAVALIVRTAEFAGAIVADEIGILIVAVHLLAVFGAAARQHMLAHAQLGGGVHLHHLHLIPLEFGEDVGRGAVEGARDIPIELRIAIAEAEREVPFHLHGMRGVSAERNDDEQDGGEATRDRASVFVNRMRHSHRSLFYSCW